MQMSKLIAEREELRVKLKGLEALSRERAELERQLAASKEELFNEQKTMRQRTEAMQEVKLVC